MSRQQRRAAQRSERKARRHSTPLAGTLAVGALIAAAPAAAAGFQVTNLNDSGPGSLRDAVAQAEANPGADTITFQPLLNGTITLTTGDLAITDPVTISGSGATITISGNNSSRIFDVENPAAMPPIDVHIDHLTLSQGLDSYGGAIRVKDENLFLDNVTVSGNTAGAGGGVAFYGGNGAGLSVTNSLITGNSSYYGGGIAIQQASGPITLTNTQLMNNQAYLVGGGVSARLAAGASVTVTGSTITGNKAGDPMGGDAIGGGLAFDGYYAYGATTPITITDTTISGNTALSGGGGEGGGIYFYYIVGAVIRQSTISGNQATFAGGGLEWEYSGLVGMPLRIENSTIANNTAAAGGGIYACAYSFSSIVNTTITGNSAVNEGGGIDFVDSTTSDVNSSIIANNTAPAGAGPDVAIDPSTTVTINYTLIKTLDGAAVITGANNITGVDPSLGPLAPVPGSPTQVERPNCGSIVINRGDPAIVPPPGAQDQRHQPRLAGPRVDMGSVEFQPSFVQFTAAAANVNENAGSITLTASRTGVDGAISVNFATADGTAKGTASGIGTPDYTPASGTLNWADYDTANKTFSVPIVNDAVFEGPENFSATLSNPSCGGVAIGVPGTETVTIIDGQTQPTLSINNVSQAEGNAGSSNFVFTVTLSGQSAQTVTVNYATANGTATAGSDYTATSGTLTFNPGVTSLPISVAVSGDTAFEGNETFTVNLSTASNATISNATGTGTITNDDGAVIDLSMTKNAGPGPFFTGQTVNYTLTVSNAGPNTATAATVTDVLPAGTTFVSATPSQGTCTAAATVTCSLGALNNGATATIALRVTPTVAGMVSNTATVSSALETDSNPANNSSTSIITVGPASQIPTLSEKMLMLLAAMFAAIGAWFARVSSRP